MNLEPLRRIQKQSAKRADNRNRKVVIRRGRKYVYHTPYKPVLGPLLRLLMPKVIVRDLFSPPVGIKENP